MFFVAEKMLIKVTMALMVGVVLGRPDKDPIHMQHRVEVDQVDKQRVFLTVTDASIISIIYAPVFIP